MAFEQSRARRSKPVPLSPKSQRWKKQREERLKNTTKADALEELLERRAKTGGKASRGDIIEIVKKYNEAGYKHVTKGVMDYMIAKHKKGSLMVQQQSFGTVPTVIMAGNESQTSDLTSLTLQDESINVSSTSTSTNHGGRPKGSKASEKERVTKAKKLAMTKAARLCLHEKQTAERANTIVAPGKYKEIIKLVEEQEDIESGSISISAIRSRLLRNNITGFRPQNTSPLEEIEPIIVQYCLKLARIRAPLTRESVILLVESLIENGVYADRMMERNKDTIRRQRGRVVDIKRHTWCTFDHFSDMYDANYSRMVECGIAVELENEVYMDKQGKEVSKDNENAYGQPTKFRLTHPELLIMVDECGSNTNQTSDGHVGRQQFVLPVDMVDGAGLHGSTVDNHFTVLPFITGEGEAVLCAIILKSEKDVTDIPINWRYGIDVMQPVLNPGNENEQGDKDDLSVFHNNSGEGRAMRGGPTCTYRGKTVPCFIATSPKASITGPMLTDMLKFMDNLDLFDRSNGKRPFLLLDGHHSRFDINFLDYVHSDPNRWEVCIGVPYGTHLWQVADSPQLNGAYKTLLV
jgi:hypothetical protein